MAEQSNQRKAGRAEKNLGNQKTADELADRALAAKAALPFSVEEVIQKLVATTTPDEEEAIWHYLDEIMPSLDEAQLARVRVEFADSLSESGRRFDQMLGILRKDHGLAA